MKKNISINISGIIFHIEEDGYEKLKNYLDSITKYFSNFDDTGEITSDIESRIAEIFLTKLNEGKQVITLEDVNDLIQTMGSIQDFQAVSQEEDESIKVEETVKVEEKISEEESPESEESKEEEKEEKYQQTSGSKKLYRDTSRRLVGGVASGIANYFNIDPLWIRLLFVILALDIFVTQSLSAVIILAYIILWIALPGNDDLEESKNVKKLYRNPDDKVLGGVSGGIAAYFGTDTTIIRLIFVLSIFLGGAGLLIYLILWIIVPEAKSITEKVQMKGEPVTLENIETSIKKNLKVKTGEEENTLVKILLFPFRLLAMVIKWLSNALGPIFSFLVDVVRVFVGVILILVGISSAVALLISLGVLLGVITGGFYADWVDVPYQMFTEAFPISGVIAAFFASAIPAIAVLLLGIMVITKSRVVKASVGWTLLAIWLVSTGILAFTIPGVIYDFRNEGEYRETITYDFDDYNRLFLKMNNLNTEMYESLDLDVRGYEGPEVKLVKEFTAYGSSRKVAIENAQRINYNVDIEDSVVTFDSNITFEKDDKFRFQELRMILYIPYGLEFVMDKDLDEILRYYSLSKYGYYYNQLGEENVWVYNRSGLECLTCNTESDAIARRQKELRDTYRDVFNFRGYYEEFDNDNFEKISFDGGFDIKIVQTEEFRVVVNGDRDMVGEVQINQTGNELEFTMDSQSNFRNRRALKVIIGMPTLTYVDLDGATTGFIKGFEEDECKVKLNGASEIDMDVEIDNLEIVLGGASKLNLSGRGQDMFADLSAASVLNAYDYRTENAEIDAAVASTAKVYVTEDLDIQASMAADIKYRGGARVRRR